MGNHLSDEDLINRLYEVGRREDSHLEQCGACQARWNRLLARRQSVLKAPEVPAEFLATQRREIYRRLDEPRGFWALRLTPALAALSMLVLGVVLSRPTPPTQPTLAVAEFTDSEFYTEIYSMVEPTEPYAAVPIYGLFEE